MTVPEKLFNDIEGLMMNLYSRWQDEREYEDINDYGKVIDPKVKAIGGQFVKMYKRPFGFTYRLEGKEYKVSMTAKTYGYKRVK